MSFFGSEMPLDRNLFMNSLLAPLPLHRCPSNKDQSSIAGSGYQKSESLGVELLCEDFPL